MRFQVGESEAGGRLDKWLAGAERLGSRARALAALERGKVFLNDAEQSAADGGRRLRAGDQIWLWLDRPGSAKRRFFSERHVAGLHLLYEDDDLLVAVKPAGLLTVPLPARPDEPSLSELIARHLRRQGKRRPLVVHRIDRDTTGLVVFAKTPQAQERLREQFARREPERVYLAVVYGRPRPDSGVWRDFLAWDQGGLQQRPSDERDERAKEAVSRYRVLEQVRGAALIEVRLVTGKRNQIRIQAGLRGHPLVGEKKYIFGAGPGRPIPFARQALHACRLAFRHPSDGRPLSFEAPLPEDLRTLLDALRG